MKQVLTIVFLLVGVVWAWGQDNSWSIQSMAFLNTTISSSGLKIDESEKDINAEFSLYGEGALRDNITKLVNDSTVINGSIGGLFEKGRHRVNVEFVIANASPRDIQDSLFFGPSLMSPNSNNLSISFKYGYLIIPKIKFSINGYFYGTSEEWQFEDITKQVNVNTFGIQFSWIPLTAKIGKDNYAMLGIDLGISSRFLLGNLAESKDEEFRKEKLGTSQTTFWGPELGLNLSIGQFNFYARIPSFGAKDDVRVDGLTGPRIIIGTSVRANILKF